MGLAVSASDGELERQVSVCAGTCGRRTLGA